MRRLMEQAKVPRNRFHDLRHAHGVLLAASGVNLKVIQERMGHSTEAFTLSRHIHATPDMQEQATSVVSRRLLSNQSLIDPGDAEGMSVEAASVNVGAISPRWGDRRKASINARSVVETSGFEPLTPCVQSRCSPAGGRGSTEGRHRGRRARRRLGVGGPSSSVRGARASLAHARGRPTPGGGSPHVQPVAHDRGPARLAAVRTTLLVEP